MTTRLKSLTDTLKMVRWQGKHKIVGDDRAIARALLAELGVNGAERVAKPQERWIEDTDEGRKQLDALPRDSVIRDHEGRVLELLSGWLLTGEHDTFSAEDIVLPALVLWTPEGTT